MDDFELAEESIFHAVENTEKAAFNAVRDEVDFMFCHPGDVHHGEHPTVDKEEVKNRKEKKKQKCLEKAASAKHVRVLDEDMRQCLDELLMGNLE